MTVFFATCPKGIEYLLRDELAGLGADAHEALAGVRFEGGAGHQGLELAYRACLESRLASRILLPLAEFNAADADALYAGVRVIDWSEHLAPDATLAIDASGSSGAITHSGFAAQKVKDAIADLCRERFGVRPTIRNDRPDVRLNLRLHKGRATLSLDLSGEPLHRRGWRREQGAAPLKENLACAMLLRADWPGLYAEGGALVDPMCGSGTLLIEAAWMAAGVAPALQRDYFGFLGWRGHDAALWQHLRDTAQERALEGLRGLRACFFGSDSDPRMLAIATHNLQSAGVAGFVMLDKRSAGYLDPPRDFASGLVITNPPYGERVGDPATLPALYGELGGRLRAGFAGWRAAVLTGKPELEHALGLRADKHYVLYNGAIECRLALFDIHARTGTGEAPVLSAGAEMVANRIRKNLRHLRKEFSRQGVDCFRVYDADLPEYAAAIDVYRGWPEDASGIGEDAAAQTWLHVQEYAPPATIDAGAAQARWRDLQRAARVALDVPRERLVTKTRVRGKGGAKYGRIAERDEFLVVEEGGLRFLVNLRDRLDTGLFLDHRLVRARLRSLARDRDVLNLFAYTGAASVYAAAGGARSTTSVDLSQGYLEWASRNLVLNGFGSSAHVLARGDAVRFLAESRTRYGLIYVDPPTFSNSRRAGDFDVQRDHVELLEACGRHLPDDGVIVFSNNFRRFTLATEVLARTFTIEDVGRASIPADFARRPRIHGCWLLRPKKVRG
ncbi:MAG TPA: bifunctional 23S rRNA (guanine(2069)-N(7))-methyltransferase RlmK/23S rRNA (guanine(2445)-N(2))-methyltransferase RlmL [Rhodanobacteraceae bacterium]|nr:bifunctional 23S rRNA (guanine(2069)-N(7))-methyltransferase RlmK/23S rRNA (guanine(2445)-N(2))-methyltransferase RlmL [Rhodanobacteraceae bacterium]